MDIERFTGGEEQPVDVAAIERELEALWMAARDAGDGTRAVTRASALTLVVPCAGNSVEEARRVVAELVGTHPARVLLLVSEPEAEPSSMTASVSAFCHRLGTEPRQICCELITLRARGAAKEHLADAVLALLAPDLPVAVWWPSGVPDRSSLLERLAPLADRWLIDTAATRDTTALRQAAALFAPQGGGEPLAGTVHDLAWIRLLPWRELTAQFFDPRAFRALLPELDLLEVRTLASDPPDAEALLWIAWLVGRLGWQPAPSGHSQPAADPDGTGWRFLRPGGEGGGAALSRGRRVSALSAAGAGPRARVLAAERASPDATGLEGVRLQATRSETTFTISRTPGTDCATLTVDSPGACPLPRAVSLPQPRTAQLLAAALDEPLADPLYLAALSLAAELQ
jgi:glucose-6-phosphate dehydrogenase assembly protein OpcA